MDYNNDGYIDLMAGDRNGQIWLFSRDAAGDLHEEGNIWGGGSEIDAGYNMSPYFVDWDEDGYLDLLVCAYDTETTYAGYIHLYLNTDEDPDSPVFTSSYTDLGFYNQWRTTHDMYDLDRDGDKDMILGYEMGQVYFAENVGTNENPQFTGYVQLEADGSPIDVGGRAREVVNDWNEDGIPDLLVGNTTDDRIAVFLGYDPGGIEEGVGLAGSFSLDILESPCCGQISLEIWMAQAGEVELSVHGADGRLVEGFDVFLAQGANTLSRDLRNAPTGVYFITARCDDRVQTGRLVLLR